MLDCTAIFFTVTYVTTKDLLWENLCCYHKCKQTLFCSVPCYSLKSASHLFCSNSPSCLMHTATFAPNIPGSLTMWKFLFPLKLNSHCIISKKMGMVAFRSSGSGTRVTSRIGPTIAGINFILWGPARKSKSDTS